MTVSRIQAKPRIIIALRRHADMRENERAVIDRWVRTTCRLLQQLGGEAV